MAMKIFKDNKETKTTATTAPVSAARAGVHIVKSVLKHPHVSEKAFGKQADRQYVFMVEMSATKTLVKEEVARRYHVKVTDVDMLVNKGKVKNFRGRPGKASKFKKAYVTLKEGDKIEIA